MNKHELELYQRIQAFDFDKVDAKITFIQRLQREHRWTAMYASGVVDEYRKFLLLAMVAGHKIIPSDQVDQAWHLHLTSSRSYWDELCPKILGKNLHHEANPGGRIEQINHHQGYQRTLASYELIFGQTPPADIWPSAEIRFGRDISFVRINSRQYWLIPKPEINWKRFALPISIIILPLLLAGCEGVLPSLDGESFLVLYVFLWLTISCISEVLRNRKSFPEYTGLTPEELAYLAGGAKRVIEVGLSKLIEQGKIKLNDDKQSFKIMGVPLDSLSELEKRIIWEIQVTENNGGTTAPLNWENCFDITSITNSIKQKGLVKIRPSHPAYVKPSITYLFMPLILMGIARLIHGVLLDKPIGFLIIVLILTALSLIWFLKLKAHPEYELSPFVNQLLKERKSSMEKQPDSLKKPYELLTGENLYQAVAVLGTTAVQNAIMPDIQQAYNYQTNQQQATPEQNNTTSKSSSGSGSNGDGDYGSGSSSHDSGDSSSFGCAGGCGGCGGGD
jgi:uncharacterized protein (TIGR04222 family)